MQPWDPSLDLEQSHEGVTCEVTKKMYLHVAAVSPDGQKPFVVSKLEAATRMTLKVRNSSPGYLPD